MGMSLGSLSMYICLYFHKVFSFCIPFIYIDGLRPKEANKKEISHRLIDS